MEIAARASEIVPFRSTMSGREYNWRLYHIRCLATPYQRRKPKRATRNAVGDYYGLVLSEVLRSIRNGEEDYVYNEMQLIDVIRYEPKATIIYMSDEQMWRVRLKRKRAC